MTPEEFVENVVNWVFKSAVDDTVRLLTSPPGSQPPVNLVRESSWYLELDDGDKDHVKHIMMMAADGALFGMFAALDGERNLGQKGEFHLFDGVTELTQDQDLHDLFRAIADENGSIY